MTMDLPVTLSRNDERGFPSEPFAPRHEISRMQGSGDTRCRHLVTPLSRRRLLIATGATTVAATLPRSAEAFVMFAGHLFFRAFVFRTVALVSVRSVATPTLTISVREAARGLAARGFALAIGAGAVLGIASDRAFAAVQGLNNQGRDCGAVVMEDEPTVYIPHPDCMALYGISRLMPQLVAEYRDPGRLTANFYPVRAAPRAAPYDVHGNHRGPAESFYCTQGGAITLSISGLPDAPRVTFSFRPIRSSDPAIDEMSFRIRNA